MVEAAGVELAVIRLFKYLAETCGYEKSRETQSGTAIVPRLFPQKLAEKAKKLGRTGWLPQSIFGLLRLSQDRPCAFKGVRRGLIFAFDAAIRGHVDIVDFRQRGFRSGSAALEQF